MDDYGRRLTLLVSSQIQELRLARGWSLERLADEAKLHRTSVGLVVRGRRGLTLDSAAALAAALNVPLHELVERAEMEIRAGE